jgi:hypothetical protein
MEIEKCIDLSIDYNNYCAEFKVSESRERRSVMFRSAYAVVLLDYFGPSAIARIIGRDHSTIIHARKNHESNLRYDSDYIRSYGICIDRINKIVGNKFVDTHPLASMSREELYNLIAEQKKEIEDINVRHQREVLELKYEIKIAKEHSKPEKAVQGVW